MKIVIGDYLSLNRATPVRVFENHGTLYVDHATDSAAPVIEYSENTLLDFAGAYYPKNLLDFAEKHGTLFNIDEHALDPLLPEKGEPIGPEPWGDSFAPSEDALRELFGKLDYPDGKKRKVTQDFKRIQRESVERDTGYTWLANQREYLGDWVAARSMFQMVLELLSGASVGGRKGACPDFAVSLADAPRYKRFLCERMKISTTKTIHHADGSITTEEEGCRIDGDMFLCHMPGKSVDDAISELVTTHIKGVRKECVNMELHESFPNLLQVIWHQIPEQIGSRLDIGWCENPKCGNVMLKLHKDEKHACCESCQQTLKEGR